MPYAVHRFLFVYGPGISVCREVFLCRNVRGSAIIWPCAASNAGAPFIRAPAFFMAQDTITPLMHDPYTEEKGGFPYDYCSSPGHPAA